MSDEVTQKAQQHSTAQPSRPTASRNRSVHYDPNIPEDDFVPRPLSRDRRVDTFDSSDPTWIPQFVLSLDGGGIRGLSSLHILKRLMVHIEAIETIETSPGNDDAVSSSFHPHDPPSDSEAKFLPCHYFDYIFGTSTGALIAIMLGRLRMSVDEAIKAYEELSKKVFARRRYVCARGPILWPRAKYSGVRLTNAVRETVRKQKQHTTGVNEPQQSIGGDTFSQEPMFNSEPYMCRTVCVAYCDAEENKDLPFLFRSYEHFSNGLSWERNPGHAHAIPIYKVARATTAAPLYFGSVDIDGYQFIDGGFGCNNPTLEAWNEVSIMHGQDVDNNIGLILSIGTGGEKTPRMPRRIAESRSKLAGKYRKLATKGNRLYHNVRAALKLATQVDTVHEQMQTLCKTGSRTFPYYRFNARGDLGKVKLDRTSAKTRRKIKEVTDRYLNGKFADDPTRTVDEMLRVVAQELVNSRRPRSQTERWDTVARGARYRCTVKACFNPQKPRRTAEILKRHIRRKHAQVLEEDLDRYVEAGRV